MNHTATAAVRMANDIAAHFDHLPPGEAAPLVAQHIGLFWDPRMRAALLAHADAAGTALTPLALAAAALLPRDRGAAHVPGASEAPRSGAAR